LEVVFSRKLTVHNIFETGQDRIQNAIDFVLPNASSQRHAGVAVTNFKCLGVDFTLCGSPYLRQNVVTNILLLLQIIN